MSKKDYYEVLGLAKNATKSEIKKAFRTLAMKFHPDRNKGHDAEDKFKEINEAYEVLHDDDKRAKYDQFGHAAFQNGGGGFQGFEGFNGFEGFGDFGDIFSSFFGNRSRGPRQGDDYVTEVEISFEESLFGKTFSQKLDKFEGDKRIAKDVEIKIPAGIMHGQSIALRGFGGPGRNGGPAGDLMVRVYVGLHKHYVRHENDIHLRMPVSAFDIMNEVEIGVPTPFGIENIKLHDRLTSTDTMVIKNKGFPSLRTGQHGNFVVSFDVYVPKLNYKTKDKISQWTTKEKDKIRDKFMKEFNV